MNLWGNIPHWTWFFLDQPHVSYHEAEGDSIKYAVRGSGGWSVLRIDDAGRYASNLTALSLSPNGNPHILYAQHMRYYTMGPLRHAYSDGENWVREAVLDDNWSSYPWYPGAFDLVVDLQGHVHVIQGGNMDGPGAWYLYKDTSWREPELIGNWTPVKVSITIGAAGQIHFATGATYVVQEAGGWFVETVDSGSFSSIDLDSNGFPHISYYDASNGDLKYAKYNGTTWAIEIIDEVGDVGSYSSLGIDLQDFAHISYYDATNGDLKYAYYNGSEWEINTLVSEGDVGSHCSLALDPFGNPYITFHDADFGDLKIIYKPHGTVYNLLFPMISR